jgi:hypothetical protein
MTERPLRVAVFGAGGIGSVAIHTLKKRPGHDLVGVWVRSPEKVGLDPCELVGGEPTGLKTTNDVEAILALGLDCAVYMANPSDREGVTVPLFERLLKAGVNIVTTTTSRAVYPKNFEPHGARLEAAAQAGRASFYTSGIEPGFAADYLPLVLSTQSSSVRSVYAAEIAIYDDYPIAEALMDGMGFGMPMDYVPHLAQRGAVEAIWGGQVTMMADALGVKLDGLRGTFEKAVSPRTFEVACGTIREGTCGAVRIQVIGVVNGRDAITVEHVNRMAHDIATDWPTAQADITYVCRIAGDPNIENSMSFSLDDAKAWGPAIQGMVVGAGATVATSMRAVNAIPYVVAAPPGLHSALTLPVTVPQGAFA